jgi:hypothetical protein
VSSGQAPSQNKKEKIVIKKAVATNSSATKNFAGRNAIRWAFASSSSFSNAAKETLDGSGGVQSAWKEALPEPPRFAITVKMSIIS